MTQFKNDVAGDGPFKLTMELSYVSDDGEIATVDYKFAPGLIPTREDFINAYHEIDETLSQAFNSGAKLRRMTRHEFVEHLFDERTGGHGHEIAVPGPNKFSLDKDVCQA